MNDSPQPALTASFLHKETLMKSILIIAALSALAAPAFAVDVDKAEKSLALEEGATVYVFKDGRMAMEDKYGRALRMKEGQLMETKDGQKIIMIGDEVARLDWLRTPPGGRG